MFLTFLVILLTFLLFYFYRINKYKVLDEFSGPSCLEIINFGFKRQTTVDSYNFMTSINNKYGPIAKVWFKPFRPMIMVSDLNIMKHIFTSKEHLKKSFILTLLEPISGLGLPIINDIPLWKKERKAFNSVFGSKLIIEYTTKFKNHAIKLSKTIEGNLDKPIDLQPLMLKTAIPIVYELLTNENVSEREEEVSTYMENIKKFLHIFFDRINSPYKINDHVFKLTKNYKIWSQSSIEAKEFVEKSFKRTLRDKLKSNRNEERDFMDLSLKTGLAHDRLFENVRTFAAAGADTVATCVSFALYRLSTRPDIQEKIYKEYTEILGEKKLVFAEFSDIQKMTYTECVVKESLRMYPPVPFLSRKLKTPVEIDGKIFPAGVDVIISIINSHFTNFENPHEFCPQRFLPENSSKIPQFGYAPFSLGPRDCIGKVIGMVESKFLLSYIIRHFTIHPVEGHKLNLAGEVVLISKTGTPVIFRKREN